MKLDDPRLLDPDALQGIADLRLLARATVEGFLVGSHLDARPGVGVEFSQYRAFERGDDPRRIDWRAYARSGRRYVREAEVEREVTVRFLLDASASMGHRDGERQPDQSKLDYTRHLVAALAYLADAQGDRLALHAISGGGLASVNSPRPPQLVPVLAQLERLEARGRWPAWSALLSALPPTCGREIVVVVSDLYEADDEVLTALSALRGRGHEVIVCHVMARNELAFSFTGDLVFEDLETGETVRADANVVADDYRDALHGFLEGWRQRSLRRGIDYHLIATDEPLDRALRALLVRRQRLG